MMTSASQRSSYAAPAAQQLCRIPADLSASWRMPDGTPVLLRPVLRRAQAAWRRQAGAPVAKADPATQTVAPS